MAFHVDLHRCSFGARSATSLHGLCFSALIRMSECAPHPPNRMRPVLNRRLRFFPGFMSGFQHGL